MTDYKKKYNNGIKDKMLDEHILCDVSDSGKILAEYPLKKISQEELIKVRRSKKPGFVLKVSVIPGRPEYWYTEVPRTFSLVSKKWLEHICGGCSILGTMEGASLKRCAWAMYIKQALRIEDHDFLTTAAEVFNTNKPAVLKITDCEHFKPYPQKPADKKPSQTGVRRLNALKLAQFIDPSLETVGDLIKFEEQNHLRSRWWWFDNDLAGFWISEPGSPLRRNS